jgi:Flp pilus assembly protein TadB
VKGFDRDYAAFLISLASSIKAGSDPLAAVISSRSLFPEDSVINEVLVDFETQIQSGTSELEAIQRFGKNVPHPDLPLFRLAFALARREGSSLADCLHRLSRVTRNRQSFRRKISAAVAMQKFSAIGISGCSLIIVSMQFINNSESFLAAAVHDSGRYMIGAGFGAILFGLFWMMRVAKRSDI